MTACKQRWHKTTILRAGSSQFPEHVSTKTTWTGTVKYFCHFRSRWYSPQKNPDPHFDTFCMIQHWVFKNYDASFPFKSANYQCLVPWTLAASHFTKAAISFFVIAELDRVGSDHIERDGHQLRKKCLGELLRRMFLDPVKKVFRSMFHPSLLHPISRYRGSIRFASCSQETLGIDDCNTSQQLCRLVHDRIDGDNLLAQQFGIHPTSPLADLFVSGLTEQIYGMKLATKNMKLTMPFTC